MELAFSTRDVEGAYGRAVEAGAAVLAAPAVMPWGQTIAYLRSVEGTIIALCTPLAS